MNYKKHYHQLIVRAKNRKLDCYTESHHIIPKCMNGDDSVENLVNLTPEEHYLAHQLLIKIYPDNKNLVYAAAMMCVSAESHSGYRSKNKLYGWLKRRLSDIASIKSSGSNNSQYGTCWIHNVEQKISKKVYKSELTRYLENGWNLGRIMKFDKPTKVNKRDLIKQETDKRYLDALNQSESISDALRSLGLRTAGAGYLRMKSVIIKNNLQHKFPHEYIVWKTSVSISGDATGSYPVEQDSNS